MKNKFLVILIVNLFGLQTIAQDDDTLIKWSEDGRLNWTDFKGIPPDTLTEFGAVSNGGIIVEHLNTFRDSIILDIGCYFNPKKSWNKAFSDILLKHEQYHLMLCEFYARKLRKLYSEYTCYDITIAKNDFDSFFSLIMGELWETHYEYDIETDYSRDYEKQSEWESKIEKQLQLYKNYSDSKVIVVRK